MGATTPPKPIEDGLRMMAAEFRGNAERSISATQQQAFAGRAMICDAAATEIASFRAALADKQRLTRELDVALNGDGAASQASLCDIVAQVQDKRWKLVRAD